MYNNNNLYSGYKKKFVIFFKEKYNNLRAISS